MTRRLRSTVHLTEGDGTTVCLLAGSVPAAAQAARITNPKAWEEGDSPPTPSTSSPAGSGGIVGAPRTEGKEGREAFVPAPESPLKPPPRKGPGSSKAAWQEYVTKYALGRGSSPAVVESMIAEFDRDDLIAWVDANKEGYGDPAGDPR